MKNNTVYFRSALISFLSLASFCTFGIAIAAPAGESKLKDPQIINILVNLNNSEVAEGRFAKQNASENSVKSFADQMVDAHSKSNADLKKLAKDLSLKTESDPIAKKLKKDSDGQLAKIKSEKGVDFDKDYIDAQVADHKDALKMLDEKLIPSAKSPQLISLLNETRAAVQQHLDMATSVQSGLKK